MFVGALARSQSLIGTRGLSHGNSNVAGLYLVAAFRGIHLCEFRTKEKDAGPVINPKKENDRNSRDTVATA